MAYFGHIKPLCVWLRAWLCFKWVSYNNIGFPHQCQACMPDCMHTVHAVWHTLQDSLVQWRSAPWKGQSSAVCAVQVLSAQGRCRYCCTAHFYSLQTFLDQLHAEFIVIWSPLKFWPQMKMWLQNITVWRHKNKSFGQTNFGPNFETFYTGIHL